MNNYPTYEELLELIEKEGPENGNNVNCLLCSIYGENEGNKLFHEWMKGNNNEWKLKKMVNELKEEQ